LVGGRIAGGEADIIGASGTVVDGEGRGFHAAMEHLIET